MKIYNVKIKTMDSDRRVIENGWVEITDGIISAVESGSPEAVTTEDIDGNGRTGRLILNLDLIRNGYPPINIKLADRKRYYDAFDEYYKNGGAAAMTDLVAGYVNERLDDYLRVLEDVAENGK